MKPIQPLEIEGKIQTPFGWQARAIVKKFVELKIISWDSVAGGWCYVVNKQPITKKVPNARGIMTEEVKDHFLPFRAYNFMFYLKKLGTVDFALAKVNGEYLPPLYNCQNYKSLMDSVRDASDEYAEWEKIDQLAKTQAFDLQNQLKAKTF